MTSAVFVFIFSRNRQKKLMNHNCLPRFWSEPFWMDLVLSWELLARPDSFRQMTCSGYRWSVKRLLPSRRLSFSSSQLKLPKTGFQTTSERSPLPSSAWVSALPFHFSILHLNSTCWCTVEIAANPIGIIVGVIISSVIVSQADDIRLVVMGLKVHYGAQTARLSN